MVWGPREERILARHQKWGVDRILFSVMSIDGSFVDRYGIEKLISIDERLKFQWYARIMLKLPGQ
jgi:hypothetical protein